jgi:hypothetical protein
MKTARIYIIVILAIIAWATPARGQQLDYPLDTINGQIYYRYTVERSIGLYRISLNFGVTQEDILKANPHLQHQGLRFEEVILIPAKNISLDISTTDVPTTDVPTTDAPKASAKSSEQTRDKKRGRIVFFDDDKRIEKKLATKKPINRKATEQKVVEQATFDKKPHSSEPIVSDTIDIDTVVFVDSLHTEALPKIDSTATQLAFLLPLHADAIKREKNMERFYDFYAGALIAIYEAQAKGQMLKVFTYDIGKTANRTKEILQQHPEIRQMDAVIGPAYSQQVAMVMDSLCKDSVRMLIPFLSRVEGIATHPNVFKFNPSEQIEADTIARYLAQKGGSVNCVLVESKEGEVIPSGIKALHAALQREQVPTTTISLRALLTDSVGGEFRSDVENIVIFNTERYANLQTVMPHLLKLCGNYRITLYSHYSWQSENIILPQLYVSVFAQEPYIPETYQALFDRYFAHELSSTHPRYDLLGYDLTSHLLHTLHHQTGNEVWEGTQTNIHYQQTAPEGGFENHIIHIIHQ